MRSFLRIFLFIAIVFAAQQKSYALVVRKDTSIVSIKKPSHEKEREVFADKKFSYKKDIAYSENPMGRFFTWLLHKLFGAATTENATTFWSILRVVLIVAVVALIIFLLFKTEIRRLFSGKAAETPVNFIDIDENINELDIDALINEALKKHNYRLATRWWYLKLLKQLSSKEYIDWKPFKTNFDYYHELNQGLLKQAFKEVSYLYESVWYGDFKIDESIYLQSVEKFRQFEQSVNTSKINA